MMAATPYQKTKLIGGIYDPTDAGQIVLSILNTQISFYHDQFIKQWEADHSTGTTYRDQKIKELQYKRNVIKALIEQSKAEGSQLSIDGVFELKVIEKPQSAQAV